MWKKKLDLLLKSSLVTLVPNWNFIFLKYFFDDPTRRTVHFSDVNIQIYPF